MRVWLPDRAAFSRTGEDARLSIGHLLQCGRGGRLIAAADVVALQLAIEGGAADAEHLAGQGFVPFDLGKDPLDGGALDIFQVSGTEVGGAAGKFLRIGRFGVDFRARDRGRQIVDFDDALIAESDGALQAIFEFADIAGPVISQHGLHGVAGDLDAASWSEALEKERRQDGNVGTALTQRRQRNGDDVEAEIEILAEGSFLVFGIEIAVGGGHDAHVHFDLLITAHGADFFLLEKAQELGLHLERKFADLVEKNGSGVGRLQQALLGTKSTGESAFFVAEQFAFDEGWDERSAVYGNKGEVSHGAAKMKGAGYEFLTGSAFAGNQNGGARVFEAGDEAQHVLNAGGIADDTVNGGLGLGAFAEVKIFFHEADLVGHAAQENAELIERGKGLGNVIVGAELHRLNCRFH